MPSFHSSVHRTGIAFLVVAGLAAGCAHDDSTTNGPSATGVTSAPPTSTGDVPGAASPDQAPSMFVLEGDSGAATPVGDPGTYELTFSGVGGVTWFADRPQRRAGEESLARFEEAWPSRFADSQPNAALTIGQGDDAEVAIVTLTDAHVEADTVRFRATVVEPEQAPPSSEGRVSTGPASELPATFQRATLFVDPSGEQAQHSKMEIHIAGTRHFTLQLDLAEGMSVSDVSVATHNLAGLSRIEQRPNGFTIEGDIKSPAEGLAIRMDVAFTDKANTGRLSGQFDKGATAWIGAADGSWTAASGWPPIAFQVRPL